MILTEGYMVYVISSVPRAKAGWHSSDGLGEQWTDTNTKSVFRGCSCGMLLGQLCPVKMSVMMKCSIAVLFYVIVSNHMWLIKHLKCD